MKDFVESIIEPLVKIVGFPSALIAAFASLLAFARSNEEKKRANIEAARANLEKERENRHRQAMAGLNALKDIFSSERAKTAMQMLDWSVRTYSHGSEKHLITKQEVANALRINNLNFSDKEIFIRDCFEDLFDRLELTEQCVKIGLVNFEDISIPLSYYCDKIVSSRDQFDPFLENYGYVKARDFIMRSAADWKKKTETVKANS